jgi:hypothetical protein
VQPNASGERRCRAPRSVQHLRRRVDAVERPAGLPLGELRQFHAATGPDNQDAAVGGHMLLEQQASHAMEAGETRHLPGRAFGIAVCDVGE